MPIQFKCPGCAKTLRASSSKAGTKAKCKGCGTVVSIPKSVPTHQRVAGRPDKRQTGSPTESAKSSDRSMPTSPPEAILVDQPVPDDPFADLPAFQSFATPVQRQSNSDDAFHRMMMSAGQEQFVPESGKHEAKPEVANPPVTASVRKTQGPDLNNISEILTGLDDSIQTSVRQQQVANERAVRAKFTVAEIRSAFAKPLGDFERLESLGRKQLVTALAALAVPTGFVVCVIGASLIMLMLAMGWLSSETRGMLHPVIGLTYVVVAILVIACWIPTFILLFVGFNLLFSRPHRDESATQLTRETQPVLYEFVDQICVKLGAPKPCRIDLNCDFNASASLRSGLLSSGKNDLVLTIGLPLIATQNTEQLASVIAHEFGHFRQGSAMKVSYLVGSITQWFMTTAAAGSTYFAWFGYLTHAISGSLSREMEWDADRHAIQLAGTKAFEESSALLERFGAAYQVTIDNLVMLFHSGILVDNIPRFMMHIGRTLPASTVRRIAEATEQQRLDRLDTHPPTRDRVKAAREMDRPGIVNLQRPSVDLVDHWKPLCERITLDFYAESLGFDRKAMNESHVTPLETLLRDEHKLLLDLAEKA